MFIDNIKIVDIYFINKNDNINNLMTMSSIYDYLFLSHIKKTKLIVKNLICVKISILLNFLNYKNKYWKF